MPREGDVTMRGTRWVAVAAVLLLGWAAGCGGDDDSTEAEAPAETTAEAAGDGGSSDDGSSDADAGPSAPEIDPSEMPAEGDTRFVVEGETYDFLAADSASSVYSCSVSPDAITVEYQMAPGMLAVQVTNDGEKWVGQLNVSPPDSDRIYTTDVASDGTFAVEGTQAVYEGDFSWRTNRDPGTLNDAGPGTLLVSC